ncbi:hypothetical protein IW262DRAFT_1457559 [Armillaria fumosa]|nr:hypothetical protein IW262DRAFT_1457559 [Armillaria fumosa]
MELDQGIFRSGVYTYVDPEWIEVSTCKTASDLPVYRFLAMKFNWCVFTSSRARQWAIQAIFPTWTNPSSVASSQPTKGDTGGVLRDYRPGPLFWTCDPFRHGHPQPRNDMPTLHMIPGQIFFDQYLISNVEATSPYNTNVIEITTNSDDQVFVLGFASTILEYFYFGGDILDGLLL